MSTKTIVQNLADFVTSSRFEDISIEALRELKIRLLDSLGTAIGAVEGTPMKNIRTYVTEMGGEEHCTLVGGGKTSPTGAAMYNGGLVRYLDFNDSYLAKHETCHPSDNIGAVMAAGEHAGISGKEFLTALAVAYQVQCRLSDEAPVRAKGFDHTTQGSYAAAAGASKALGLDAGKTANAIAISGTAFNALRVTRTGALSNWKGLAYPNTGFAATHATYLARHGITGPEEVFEGNKGFMDSIAGEFSIDWQQENLERVTKTIIKKYNAEIHSQSTLEGIEELMDQNDIDPQKIETVELETFDVAFHIIGGGEEGDKRIVRTKEEADHSLHYMMAAMLLDGQVMPEQYEQDRIDRDDIQQMLRRITVRENESYSQAFPDKVRIKVIIHMEDGTTFEREKSDYTGFVTRPMDWNTVTGKFTKLAKPYTSSDLREKLVDMVKNLEDHDIRELTSLLAQVKLSA